MSITLRARLAIVANETVNRHDHKHTQTQLFARVRREAYTDTIVSAPQLRTTRDGHTNNQTKNGKCLRSTRRRRPTIWCAPPCSRFTRVRAILRETGTNWCPSQYTGAEKLCAACVLHGVASCAWAITRINRRIYKKYIVYTQKHT